VYNITLLWLTSKAYLDKAEKLLMLIYLVEGYPLVAKSGSLVSRCVEGCTTEGNLYYVLCKEA